MPAIRLCLVLRVLLLGDVPLDPVLHDHVDIVEENTLYNEQGELSFRQIIFWRWNADLCRHEVVAWRMAPKARNRSQPLPGGGRVVILSEAGVLRKITANRVRRTYGQTDPEVDDRAILPQDNRKELTKPYSSSPR